MDSRSVRTSHHIDSSEYGIDGGKRGKRGKEHIIVDTLGLPMAVKVHAVNIYDSVGAVGPIGQLRFLFPRLKKIITDGGYRGKTDLAETMLQITFCQIMLKKFGNNFKTGGTIKYFV